jgi:putative endonuclease
MLSLPTPRGLFEKARARFRRAPQTPAPQAHAPQAHAPQAAAPQALAQHAELGRRGETLAAEYLLARGYELVAANFKLGVGRNRRGAVVEAEIDLVAYDGPVLCFVEVKTRRSDWFAAPEANVDLRKQRQVTRAARAYRRLLGLSGAPTRFDVVAVILPPPDAGGHEPAPRLRLLRGFWSEDKFRKRRWGTSAG